MTEPAEAVALSNAAHLYARPDQSERLVRFFKEVLGLEPRELEPREVAKARVAASHPMIAVSFSNGAALSVEFSEDALSDTDAERAGWLELTSPDPEAVQGKALAFGLKKVVHPATPFFYIQAPGGQIFRITGPTDPARGAGRPRGRGPEPAADSNGDSNSSGHRPPAATGDSA
jgi:hypothetical protein